MGWCNAGPWLGGLPAQVCLTGLRLPSSLASTLPPWPASSVRLSAKSDCLRLLKPRAQRPLWLFGLWIGGNGGGDNGGNDGGGGKTGTWVGWGGAGRGGAGPWLGWCSGWACLTNSCAIDWASTIASMAPSTGANNAVSSLAVNSAINSTIDAAIT